MAACTHRALLWLSLLIAVFFLESSATTPVVSIQSSLSSNDGTSLLITLSVSTSTSGTLYCLPAPDYTTKYTAAQIANASSLVSYTSAGNWDVNVTGDAFPSGGYMFSNGPWFQEWPIWCAGEDGSTSALSSVATVNATTGGTLGRLLDVTVVDDTSEEGVGYAEIEFSLIDAPTDPVRFEVYSSDEDEAVVSTEATHCTRQASYIFTPSYYEGTAYFLGQEDGEDDGDVAYEGVITFLGAMDARYRYVPEGITHSVALTSEAVEDSWQYGSAFDDRRLKVYRLENVTTESDTGATKVAEVVLTAAPAGQVLFRAYSSDASEAFVMYPSLFAFDSDDWDQERSIYVQSESDDLYDPSISYNIKIELVHTEDPLWDRRHKLTTAVITAQNQESSSVGIKVTQDNCPDEFDEDYAYTSCTIKIGLCYWPFSSTCDAPTADELTALGYASFALDLTLSDSALATFKDGTTAKSLEWDVDTMTSTTKTIYFLPVDDDLYEADADVTLSYSTAEYTDTSGTTSTLDSDKIGSLPLTKTIIDDDTPEVVFDYGDCLSPETSEDGRECAVSCYLGSEPTADVTFTVSLSTTTYAEISESGGGDYTLTFTSANWDTVQTVTVEGKDNDDTVNAATPTYVVTRGATASSDTDYVFDAQNYTFSQADNDFDGLYVSTPATSATDETGLSQNFTAYLLATPSEHVTLSLASSDTAEATVDPDTVKFLVGTTTALKAEGFGGACSAGEVLTCAGGCLSNSDCVSSSRGLSTCLGWVGDGTCDDADTTSDSGETMDFSCALYEYDAGDCDSATATSSTEPTVSGALYTYYDAEVSVDIDGEDDDLVDGGVTYTVSASTSSDDSDFDGLSASISMINYDDDIVSVGNSSCVLDEAEPFDECRVELIVTSNVNKYRYLTVTGVSFYPDQADFTNSPLTITTAGTYYLYVAVVDDRKDDGNFHGNLTVTAELSYAHHGALGSKALAEQVNALTVYDNDTMGVVVAQGADEWVSYKVDSKRDDQDFSKKAYPYLSEVTFPNRTTSESTTSQNASFSFRLYSPPMDTVTVYLKSEKTDANGGDSRFEGVPVAAAGDRQAAPYAWTRAEITDLNGDHIAYVDSLDDDRAELNFTFDGSNWHQPYTVTVVGLEDAVDDYTVEYELTLYAESDGDRYYDGHTITLPFLNQDNDKANFHIQTISNECSEPDLGLTGELAIWLDSEPKQAVLISITSSDSVEALPTESIIVINKNNWETYTSVYVSSVDDPYQDGDQYFNVSVGIVFSEDTDYGSGDANDDGAYGVSDRVLTAQFISYDDPSDASATACLQGQYGAYPDCYSCPAGTYADLAGDKTACRNCPPGTYGVVTGAYAMTASETWDGTAISAGCLPCPAGTYGPDWGRNGSCLACPEGKACAGLATTTPQRAEAANRSTQVTHSWSLVELDEFDVSLYDHQLSIEYFQGLLFAGGLIFFSILGVFFWFAIKCLPKRMREFIFAKLAKMDKFVDAHLEVYDHDEEADDEEQTGAALGGFMTLSGLGISAVICGLMVYLWLFYNTLIDQVLVPLDLDLVAELESEFTFSVKLEGFSGCLGNATDMNDDGMDDTLLEVSVAYFNNLTYEAYCLDGDYVVDMAVPTDTVDGIPTVVLEWSLNDNQCDQCVTEYAADGNGTLVCGDCPMISAQTISFELYATDAYPGDTNHLKGTLTPATASSSFRGGDKTEINLNIVPTFYANDNNGRETNGFRLQYSDTTEGTTTAFSTNGTVTENNYDDVILENEFMSMDSENTISVQVKLVTTTFALTIQLSPDLGWLDLLGELGGIVSTVLGLTMVAMIKAEQVMHPDTKEKVIAAKEWVGKSFRRLKSGSSPRLSGEKGRRQSHGFARDHPGEEPEQQSHGFARQKPDSYKEEQKGGEEAPRGDAILAGAEEQEEETPPAAKKKGRLGGLLPGIKRKGNAAGAAPHTNKPLLVASEEQSEVGGEDPWRRSSASAASAAPAAAAAAAAAFPAPAFPAPVQEEEKQGGQEQEEGEEQEQGGGGGGGAAAPPPAAFSLEAPAVDEEETKQANDEAPPAEEAAPPAADREEAPEAAEEGEPAAAAEEGGSEPRGGSTSAGTEELLSAPLAPSTEAGKEAERRQSTQYQPAKKSGRLGGLLKKK